MFCPGCGKEVSGGDAFCRSCGHSLSSQKLASTESVEPARPRPLEELLRAYTVRAHTEGTMWMKLRLWWYHQFNPKKMPRDVREYTIHRYIKVVVEGAKTPEEKVEASTMILDRALALQTDPLSFELTNDLVKIGWGLIEDLPLAECACCGLHPFVHEAVKIDDKFYHKDRSMCSVRNLFLTYEALKEIRNRAETLIAHEAKAVAAKKR
jgi:hypothetical protein